jgi:hypothetical protein
VCSTVVERTLVVVTLTLEGGHQFSISLMPDLGEIFGSAFGRSADLRMQPGFATIDKLEITYGREDL